MVSYRDNEQALKDVMPRLLLNDFIDWISRNLYCEDVFDSKELSDWAERNGYVKQED